MHEEKPGRAIGFKNERFSDKEEDGKAGPGEFKRSSEKAQAWETRLAHVGILTAIPQIRYNLFIMRVIMGLNQFFTGIPFELLRTQFPLGEKITFPSFNRYFLLPDIQNTSNS